MRFTKHGKGKGVRSKRGPQKLVRGTRAASLVFTLLATFIASNIAIFAANTYYNLDTGEIIVDQVQRVTDAIRATGGLIVGGGATDDPDGIFEVAGTGNITFSTTGTITQTGTGAVQFNGDTGIGGAAANYEFEVTDSDSSGIVAQFHGRVIGVDAVNPTDFVTLQQLTSGSGGGVLNAFVQGGNSFGTTAILGTNDGNDLQIETGGATKFTVFNDATIVALFSGRVRGSNAVNADEFVTKAQLDAVGGAASLTLVSDPLIAPDVLAYLSLNGQEITMHRIDISNDTNLAAGAGLALTGDSLGVDGVLEDLDTLGAPTIDGQFIVSAGAGIFAYESGATARASLGLTIGTDVQAFSTILQNTTASFLVADETKLDGIEALADVTDATNVAAAGAIMDTDFLSNGLMTRTGAGTYSIVADNSANWNTAFGWGDHGAQNYFDIDTDTITSINGVTITGPIADNEIFTYDSTSSQWTNQTPVEAGLATTSDLHSAVTLAGENYLSLAGQVITANAINLGTTNVTGTLPVNRGGTGAATHTAGGVLFGNGTSAITNSGVLANGQLLIGDGTGAPTVATLTEGTGVTITNGAGSITISADMGDLDGEYFAQGGNAFAAPAVLGTTDANSLSFVTGVGGTSRMTIGAAGGVTLASGNDFTVTSGTSSFGGDINLTGGARTINATAGILTLDSSSNIQFFDGNNFITPTGDLTIAGDFTLSGLTISNDGTLTTIASTGGDGLVLDSASDVITLGSGDNLFTGGGYDLTSGSVFREVHPIFGFDVPIRCSTACNNTYVNISRAIENYEFPSAYAGTTRQHNFTIHYADSLSAGTTAWQVWNVTDNALVSSFTVPFSPTNDLDDSAAIYTTGDVTIPTDGDDWVLRVSMPLGGTLQVNQVFLGAYDVITQ